MQRLRLYDCRTSRLPNTVGLCQDNIPDIADYVNSAQRRLLMCKEACDDGWWGTWAEIVFNVSQATPYITLPREIARLEAINVCTNPVAVQNQFFEYLAFGNGRMPKINNIQCNQGVLQAFTRNNAVTFTEMTNAPQYLVAYATDSRDFNKRVLFSGTDAANVIITTTDVQNQVQGQFVNLESTPAMTPQVFSAITGIQKDVTIGIVRIYQHDPTTGDEILLLTMEPSETTASYRRYYINQLPAGCCPNPLSTNNSPQVQVTAIAKLDLIPVVTDTDYCLIQNLEAIIEECQSIRYSQMDSPTAKQMSNERHAFAIGLLNGELNHFIGRNEVSVGLFSFGSANLRRQKIGTLI